MFYWLLLGVTVLPYVVFPGNVGEKDTLRDLVANWARPDSAEVGAPAMQYQR